jgi:hypothetical protein
MAMLAILPNRRVLTQQGLRVIWAEGDVMDVMESACEEGDLGIRRDSVGSGRGQVKRVPSNPGHHEHGSAARRSVLYATEILFLIGRGTPRARSAGSWPLRLR